MILWFYDLCNKIEKRNLGNSHPLEWSHAFSLLWTGVIHLNLAIGSEIINGLVCLLSSHLLYSADVCRLLLSFALSLGKSYRLEQAGFCHVNRIWVCWLINLQDNFSRLTRQGCLQLQMTLWVTVSCLPYAQVQNGSYASIAYARNALFGEGDSIGAVCSVTSWIEPFITSDRRRTGW